jgi:hypothetical protein
MADRHRPSSLGQQPVSSEQRFDRDNPCPHCGGYAEAPKGSPERCWGYVVQTGKGVYCAQDDGGRPHPTMEGVYWHPLRSSNGAALQLVDERWVADELQRQEQRGSGGGTVQYHYRDEHGKLIRTKYRFSDSSKSWSKSGPRVDVPYRLPELIEGCAQGSVVYVVDGEKDVEALRQRGVVATCAPNGMGNWRDEYTAWLAGASRVVIVQDNDSGAGKKGAEKVRQSVRRMAPALSGGLPAVSALVMAAEGKDAHDHFEAGYGLDEFVPVEGSAVAEVLNESRVDLVARINDGLPEPEYVTGGTPWLRQGKRYLIPAPAGTGKSLGLLVVAVDIVEAGGTARILDIENGDEEYAGRLALILESRDKDGSLATACAERLHYHAWPAMSMQWDPEDWAEANADVDVVIFDSSRLILSSAGLAEDRSDDYATFVNALLIPLSRNGVTTIVLDNTGHEDKERSRGTKAKDDLNEVVYAMKEQVPFDVDKGGELRLKLKRQRFGGLPQALRIPVGGGTYGPVEVAGDEEREHVEVSNLEKKKHSVMMAVQHDPGINRTDLRKVVKGDSKVVWEAVKELEDDGRIRVENVGGKKYHYPIPSEEREQNS